MAGEIIKQSTQLKAAYDTQYTQHDSEWRYLGAKQKAENIQRLVRNIEKPRLVLEVGAGDGAILRHLISANFAETYAAAEISESGIKNMQALNLPQLIDIRLFDGYQLPYQDNEFDLLILSHVLEHVEFPRALLREIKRVSRYHVIEIPCDFSFDVDTKTQYFLAYGHINIYTPSLLRFFLLSEGFTIHSDYVSLTDPQLTRYHAYHQRAWRKTWKSELRLRGQSFWKQLRYHFANPNDKQLLADAYTVLCEKSEHGLEIFV
jgi:ubiquinone/menaquinone biosynthesis C-methylase UbiE